MKIQLIRLIASLLAGGMIMILHEFPKAFIYSRINNNRDKAHIHKIGKLHHYIDPIGLILCVTYYAGFSKPYMYRIKDKKTNMILGIAGFLSLLLIFAISMSLLRFQIGMNSDFSYSGSASILELFYQCFVFYLGLISICMFMVNLFPVSTFDMGLCIAGKSPTQYFNVIRNDYFIKVLLILVILFQFFSNIGTLIMGNLLS